MADWKGSSNISRARERARATARARAKEILTMFVCGLMSELLALERSTISFTTNTKK